MADVDQVLNTSRTYFLASGIANVLAAIAWISLAVFGGIVGIALSCLLSIMALLVLILPIVNLVVAVFDFLAASKVRSRPSPRVYSFLKFTAILDLFAFLAMVPLVMGILNLELLARPAIRRHFHPGTPAPDA